MAVELALYFLINKKRVNLSPGLVKKIQPPTSKAQKYFYFQAELYW